LDDYALDKYFTTSCNTLFPDMKKFLFPVLVFALAFGLRAVETHSHPPGMLGVALHEIMAEEVIALNLPGEFGAWVKGVGPDSPAAKAGIQDDDVIVSYNGLRVESARAMQRMVLETPAGRTVELRLIRDGKPVIVQPTLGAGKMPTVTLAPPRAPKSLGVGVEPVASAVGQYLGLNDGVGVIVRVVKEDSPAAEAGLLPKDILVNLNDTEITSAEALGAQIKSLNRYEASLTLIRGTETLTVDLAL
jgi:serine protease Do